jgi:hypothetical protein
LATIASHLRPEQGQDRTQSNRILPDLRLLVLPLETYSPQEKGAAEKRAPTWKTFEL